MNALTQFIQQQNFTRKIFGDELLPEDPASLTKEQIESLKRDIDCDLSPENLHCDGEALASSVNAKLAMLNGAKEALEQLPASK